MKLNIDPNGRILMINNKELCLLSMTWTKINDPEVFELMGKPGAHLKSFKDGYEEGSQNYKNLSRKDKRKVRRSKIKFVKWYNKNHATEDTILQVPTMSEPNSLGEKLYD